MNASFEHGVPAEIAPQTQEVVGAGAAGVPTPQLAEALPTAGATLDPQKVKAYVIGWRDRLRTARTDKMGVWNECWELYRGREDWSDKEDWQTKI